MGTILIFQVIQGMHECELSLMLDVLVREGVNLGLQMVDGGL